MEIQKAGIIPKKALKEMEEKGFIIKPGQWYLKMNDLDDFDVIEIIKVEHNKYGTYIHYNSSTDWECTEFELTSKKYEELQHYYKLKLLEDGIDSFKKYRNESLKVINGEIKPDFYNDNASDNINEERALVGNINKAALQKIQQDLESKKNHAGMIKSFVEYEMEIRKRNLMKIKDEMYAVLAEFEKKITKIMRVITTIELYLGIEEELFQIQEGQAAKETVPISFRQMVLYMDEETGHWEGGGLDYSNIEWFDEWLIKKDNFKKLLPEEKGVVVFRPRRFKKDYGDINPIVDARMSLENLNSTYLLIRNGDNVYRIFSDKIVILPRLFPKRKELEAMLKNFDEITWESEKEKAKEVFEDTIYHYRQRAALMQGLIDRSDVFKPMKQQVSIFNMEKTPGAVQFIYDDELILPSGKLPFFDWVEKINSKIKEGSRVLNTGVYNSYKGWHSSKDYKDRFYKNYNDYNVPDLPAQGVYTVEDYRQSNESWLRKHSYDELIKKHPDGKIETSYSYGDKKVEEFRLVKTKEHHFRYYGDDYGDKSGYLVRYTNVEADLVIKYKPSKEARSGWGDWEGHDRKNNVSFKIDPKDRFILNYDQISLEDVEFYLNSRVDRPNYLEMMPVLEKIKDERIKEYKQEREFFRFVVERNISKLKLDEKIIREMVVDSAAWWKYKNKWKRPILKDDTLALRMIEKRINSVNYKNLKTI